METKKGGKRCPKRPYFDTPLGPIAVGCFAAHPSIGGVCNVDIVGEGHAEDLSVPDRVATKRALKIVGVPSTAGEKLSGRNPPVAMATPTIFR